MDQPNYDFKPTITGDSILGAFQRKAQIESENRARELAAKQQGWETIAQTATKFTSDMIAGAKAAQKRDMINTLASTLATSSIPGTTPVYDARKANEVRALGTLDPEALTAQASKNLFQDPNAALVAAQTKAATLQGKLYENDLKKGQLGQVPETVRSMLKTGGIDVPEGMTMAELKASLPGMGAGMRASVLGEIAKARGDQVSASLADKMGTDINPAKWTPGSPGGVAAQRVLAAKDAKSLFETIRSQPDGPTKRQSVEAAIATVKTLMGSGNGQVSEKLINDMIPQSAKGRYATWEEFLTNAPQGNDQQKFMDQFEHQIDRVNEVNGSIVDDRVRQAISTHKVLHKRDPEAWTAQMEAAGLDPADVKNDVYKPQSIRRLRNTALGKATSNRIDLGNGATYEVLP